MRGRGGGVRARGRGRRASARRSRKRRGWPSEASSGAPFLVSWRPVWGYLALRPGGSKRSARDPKIRVLGSAQIARFAEKAARAVGDSARRVVERRVPRTQLLFPRQDGVGETAIRGFIDARACAGRPAGRIVHGGRAMCERVFRTVVGKLRMQTNTHTHTHALTRSSGVRDPIAKRSTPSPFLFAPPLATRRLAEQQPRHFTSFLRPFLPVASDDPDNPFRRDPARSRESPPASTIPCAPVIDTRPPAP